MSTVRDHLVTRIPKIGQRRSSAQRQGLALLAAGDPAALHAETGIPLLSGLSELVAT